MGLVADGLAFQGCEWHLCPGGTVWYRWEPSEVRGAAAGAFLSWGHFYVGCRAATLST